MILTRSGVAVDPKHLAKQIIMSPRRQVLPPLPPTPIIVKRKMNALPTPLLQQPQQQEQQVLMSTRVPQTTRSSESGSSGMETHTFPQSNHRGRHRVVETPNNCEPEEQSHTYATNEDEEADSDDDAEGES